MNRREFLTGATTTAASIALLSGAKPAQAKAGQPIKIGFIPLTDCASIVMADKLGLFKKYGLNAEATKESNCSNVRDKLLESELHATCRLFGMRV